MDKDMEVEMEMEEKKDEHINWTIPHLLHIDYATQPLILTPI